MKTLPTKKVKAYFIGGISGVGKSRILNELEKFDQRFRIIYGSKYFMKWFGLKINDYKALRALPDNFKNKELDKMMRFLIYHPPNPYKPLLIDAHYLKINNGKVANAVGNRISLFDALFLINAKPKEILERINQDFLVSDKNRELFPPEIDEKEKLKLLRYYLQKNIQTVQNLSRRFKVPYFVINNNNNMMDKTIRNFLRYIETIEKR